MPYEKPLPKINADNAPFWEGCRQHELKFQQCSHCKHIRWPPSHLCPRCHETAINWLISKGVGKIYTFAVYHAAFHPGFKAELPYTVAVVELDEGPHILTNIIGCPPEKVTCDMPVQVTWEEIEEGICLPKFMPRDGATGQDPG